MYSIHLYAEVLLNIKTVSLSANVIGDDQKPSVAQVLVGAGTIRFKHRDDELLIHLPCRVPENNPTSLDLAAARDKKVSLRLAPDQGLYKLAGAQDDQINHTPWGASIFPAAVTMYCASCGTIIIPSQSITQWKDLPSENWAEMMDFWHCHKPDVPNTNSTSPDAPAKKGYAASNTFLASKGLGLISLSSFLFARDDVDHINECETSIGSNIPECNIKCENCSAPLGSTDENARGLRLLKSSLQLRPTTSGLTTRIPAQKWIAEHLLNLVETQAARKFLVRPKLSGARIIWVFTPDYLFCSVTTSNKTQYNHPTRAMKILSKPISSEEADILDSNKSPTAAVEDLNLPIHLHENLVNTLRENAFSVPTSTRAWGEWEVSFLLRFSHQDLRAGPYGAG